MSSHVSFDRYSNGQLFRSWLEDMVDYQLSGAVEARAGGALVPLGGPKQRCVLAVLLVNHGSVVSVDRLIDAVWEDNPPPKALASLRAYVTNLRRALPVSTDTASPSDGKPSARSDAGLPPPTSRPASPPSTR